MGNVLYRNNEARSRNYYCCGKVISIILHILSVFVALVVQHAKRMGTFILSPVTCPPAPDFCTSSHKEHDFRGEKLLNIKGLFDFLSNF